MRNTNLSHLNQYGKPDKIEYQEILNIVMAIDSIHHNMLGPKTRNHLEGLHSSGEYIQNPIRRRKFYKDNCNDSGFELWREHGISYSEEGFTEQKHGFSMKNSDPSIENAISLMKDLTYHILNGDRIHITRQTAYNWKRRIPDNSYYSRNASVDLLYLALNLQDSMSTPADQSEAPDVKGHYEDLRNARNDLLDALGLAIQRYLHVPISIIGCSPQQLKSYIKKLNALSEDNKQLNKLSIHTDESFVSDVLNICRDRNVPDGENNQTYYNELLSGCDMSLKQEDRLKLACHTHPKDTSNPEDIYDAVRKIKHKKVSAHYSPHSKLLSDLIHAIKAYGYTTKEAPKEEKRGGFFVEKCMQPICVGAGITANSLLIKDNGHAVLNYTAFTLILESIKHGHPIHADVIKALEDAEEQAKSPAFLDTNENSPLRSYMRPHRPETEFPSVLTDTHLAILQSALARDCGGKLGVLLIEVMDEYEIPPVLSTPAILGRIESICPTVSDKINPTVSDEINPTVSDEINPTVSDEINPTVSDKISRQKPKSGLLRNFRNFGKLAKSSSQSNNTTINSNNTTINPVLVDALNSHKETAVLVDALNSHKETAFLVGALNSHERTVLHRTEPNTADASDFDDEKEESYGEAARRKKLESGAVSKAISYEYQTKQKDDSKENEDNFDEFKKFRNQSKFFQHYVLANIWNDQLEGHDDPVAFAKAYPDPLSMDCDDLREFLNKHQHYYYNVIKSQPEEQRFMHYLTHIFIPDSLGEEYKNLTDRGMLRWLAEILSDRKKSNKRGAYSDSQEMFYMYDNYQEFCRIAILPIIQTTKPDLRSLNDLTAEEYNIVFSGDMFNKIKNDYIKFCHFISYSCMPLGNDNMNLKTEHTTEPQIRAFMTREHYDLYRSKFSNYTQYQQEIEDTFQGIADTLNATHKYADNKDIYTLVKKPDSTLKASIVEVANEYAVGSQAAGGNVYTDKPQADDGSIYHVLDQQAKDGNVHHISEPKAHTEVNLNVIPSIRASSSSKKSRKDQPNSRNNRKSMTHEEFKEYLVNYKTKHSTKHPSSHQSKFKRDSSLFTYPEASSEEEDSFLDTSFPHLPQDNPEEQLHDKDDLLITQVIKNQEQLQPLASFRTPEPQLTFELPPLPLPQSEPSNLPYGAEEVEIIIEESEPVKDVPHTIPHKPKKDSGGLYPQRRNNSPNQVNNGEDRMQEALHPETPYPKTLSVKDKIAWLEKSLTS